MESAYVFNHCIFALLTVLLCCATVVNSQVLGEGSATGSLCDDTTNPCTEADEICFQPDVDSEPSCIIDPCREGSFQNGACPTSQKCISAGNCADMNRCGQIPQYKDHTCIDPCLTDTSCNGNRVCTFDATVSNAVMCNGGSTGVCNGVSCNGNGDCNSVPANLNGAARAMCDCNDGYNNVDSVTCETTEETVDRLTGERNRAVEIYRVRFRIRVINIPWVQDYRNPASQLYKEYKQKTVTECVRLYGRRPGFAGCRLTGLSPGSIITQMEVLFDNPVVTDQVAKEILMGDLTNRTNVNTDIGEHWWGDYLQVSESDIEFQQVSNEAPTTSSSALLPAVLGSTMAVVVIVLAVVLLYYFGRVCRNRYYAGTYEDSEDTETTYQTRSQPQYFYTRNNPQNYGWGMHGRPNYWSQSPTQQQGSWGDRQWFWTNRNR